MKNEKCEKCKCKIEIGSESFKACKVYCQICYEHVKVRTGRPEGSLQTYYKKWMEISNS